MGLHQVTLVISLICISFAAAQSYNTDLEESNGTFSGTIVETIVNWVTRSIQYLFEVFDIKVRVTRFLLSLYNTDNLVLVKRILNMGLRFGGWVYGLIPDSTSEANSLFLSLLFPHLGDDYPQRKREVIAGDGLEVIKEWPAWGGDEAKSASGADELGEMDDAEQQIVNLNALINGRGNMRH